MALGDIIGGIGAAYDGYTKGKRDAEEDVVRNDVNAYNKQVRTSQLGLLPAQEEAARAELSAISTKARDEVALAPQRREVTAGELAAKKHEQERAAAQWTNQALVDAYQRQATGQQLVDTVTAKAGEYLSRGDLDSVKGLLSFAFSTDLMPEMKKLGPIGSVSKENAPEGATTVGGAPISGEALKISFASGNVGYIDPKVMLALYKRQLDEADRKGAQKMDPGQVLVGAGGRPLYTAPDKPLIVGINQGAYDKNGKEIVASKENNTGGAAGARGAGKAEPAALDAAMKMLDKTLTEVGEKVATPADRAKAQNYLGTVMQNNPSIRPDQAVRIAVDALANPATVAPAIDKKTGTIDLTYRNRAVAGDNIVVLAVDAVPVDEAAKTMDKTVMAKEVSSLLQGQRPENRQAFIEAASSPEKRAQLMTTISNLPYPSTPEGTAARNAELARAGRITDLVAKFGPKAAPAPGAQAAQKNYPAAGDKPIPEQDRIQVIGRPPAAEPKRSVFEQDKEVDAKAAAARQASERDGELARVRSLLGRKDDYGNIRALAEIRNNKKLFDTLDADTQAEIYRRAGRPRQQ